jgi:cytochrome c
MKLMKMMGISLMIGVLGTSFAWAEATESATPEEVIAKVNQAAKYLHEKGDSAVAEFNAKTSQWIWKDSYVFIYNCQQNRMIAHPFRPDLVDKPILQIKDTKGTLLFQKLCEAGKSKNGGWVEYYWDKPGDTVPSRKISYALSADVSFKVGIQVGAGIYDDKATLEQLTGLIGKMTDPSQFPAP